MKSKRRFLKLFLFLIIVSAVFACGWMQLFMENTSCAVMTSKTSGLHQKILKNGSFDWRWEHLIPFNVKLSSFDTESKTFNCKTEGSLSQSELYSAQVSEKPDFSYLLEYRITLRVKEEQIFELYKNNIITDQASLDSYLQTKAKNIADSISEKIIAENTDSSVSSDIYTEKKVMSFIKADTEDLKYITLDSVILLEKKLPDIELYQRLKDSYFKLTLEIDNVLKNKAEVHAKNLFEDKRVLEKLENFVILMEKYPTLKEISQTSDIAQIMKVLGELE